MTRHLPALLALAAGRLAATDAPEPWRALTSYRFPEAKLAFEQSPASANASFGLALTLINLQPKTEANLDRAAALLQEVAASPADQELALAARFYLGRIAQVHRRKPDPAAAQRLYRALMDEHPASFWAQLAGVKWVTLQIYTAGPATERAARLGELEAMAGFFTLPQFAKDYHNIMANAYEALAISDAKAFEHLAACWRIGIARGIDQGDFLARLGTLAERLGRADEARRFYSEFLARFQRDERRYLIEQRLAALERTAAR